MIVAMKRLGARLAPRKARGDQIFGSSDLDCSYTRRYDNLRGSRLGPMVPVRRHVARDTLATLFALGIAPSEVGRKLLGCGFLIPSVKPPLFCHRVRDSLGVGNIDADFLQVGECRLRNSKSRAATRKMTVKTMASFFAYRSHDWR